MNKSKSVPEKTPPGKTPPGKTPPEKTPPGWYIEIEDWKCPKCGFPPSQYNGEVIMCLDGGSVFCNNKKCGTLFHFCPLIKNYSLKSPVSCGCMGFFHDN